MGSSRDPDQYTTAEFRKSMSLAFETARYQDAVVQVNHHGKPWVSIVSPASAEMLSRVNSIGKLTKSDLGAIYDAVDAELDVNELLERLINIRQ